MKDEDIRELVYTIGILKGICTSLASRTKLKDMEIKNYHELLDQMKNDLRTVVGRYLPEEPSIDESQPTERVW